VLGRNIVVNSNGRKILTQRRDRERVVLSRERRRNKVMVESSTRALPDAHAFEAREAGAWKVSRPKPRRQPSEGEGVKGISREI
jgi:hypothetical protein